MQITKGRYCPTCNELNSIHADTCVKCAEILDLSKSKSELAKEQQKITSMEARLLRMEKQLILNSEVPQKLKKLYPEATPEDVIAEFWKAKTFAELKLQGNLPPEKAESLMKALQQLNQIIGA